MQNDQTFFRRFFDGVSWGVGFGLAVGLILVTVVFAIDWIESGPRRGSVEVIDWHSFEVSNKTHFLNESSENDGGLHISGEIKFTELPDKSFVSVMLTVRNETGGYVDSCADEFPVAYLSEKKRSFNVHCDNVFTEEQFRDYEVSIRAYDR